MTPTSWSHIFYPTLKFFILQVICSFSLRKLPLQAYPLTIGSKNVSHCHVANSCLPMVFSVVVAAAFASDYS